MNKYYELTEEQEARLSEGAELTGTTALNQNISEQIKVDLVYLLGYCRGIGYPIEKLEAKYLSDLRERVEKLENKGQSVGH